MAYQTIRLILLALENTVPHQGVRLLLRANWIQKGTKSLILADIAWTSHHPISQPWGAGKQQFFWSLSITVDKRTWRNIVTRLSPRHNFRLRSYWTQAVNHSNTDAGSSEMKKIVNFIYNGILLILTLANPNQQCK